MNNNREIDKGVTFDQDDQRERPVSAFGRWLSRMLEIREMKPTAFSTASGIPDSTVSRWLTGKSEAVYGENLRKIASFFEMPVAQIEVIVEASDELVEESDRVFDLEPDNPSWMNVLASAERRVQRAVELCRRTDLSESAQRSVLASARAIDNIVESIEEAVR